MTTLSTTEEVNGTAVRASLACLCADKQPTIRASFHTHTMLWELCTPTDATRRTQVTCLRPQSMSPVLRTPERHGHPSTPRSDEHTSRSLKFKKKSPNQRELRVTPRAFTTHTSVSASTPAAPTEPWLTPTEGTYQICCILPGLELRISFKCLPLITGSLKKARQGAIPGGLIALCGTLQGAAYGFPSQALPSVPRS